MNVKKEKEFHGKMINTLDLKEQQRIGDSARVVNCRFAFRCDKTWQGLNMIAGVSDARYCTGCRTAVHYCRTQAQVERHAKLGHCVAAEVGGRILMGDVAPDWNCAR